MGFIPFGWPKIKDIPARSVTIRKRLITMAIVNVYIDGFNLYYGALKGSPYKWLDLYALCRHMLPANTIQFVEYFTRDRQCAST